MKELQDLLNEEQEEHDRTDKKLLKAKRDLEDTRHELLELKKVCKPKSIFQCFSILDLN